MEDFILTKENIGLDRISPSMLDKFEQCPKLFYYEEWLGLKLPENKMHMEFGTAIHSAIEQIYLEFDNHFGGGWMAGSFYNVQKKFLSYWKPGVISEEEFKMFLETKSGKEKGFKTVDELYTYMRSDGMAMLKSYWDEKENLFIEHDHDLSDFEVVLKTALINPDDSSETLPIPLSARLDAMNRGKTKIVDFKTSKDSYDVEETRKKIQGQCYLFGNLMISGKFISKMDYIVLRKELKSDRRIEVVSLEYDMADMSALFQRIKAILIAIAMRQFDRPQKGHMPYCRCKKYDELLNVKENI